MNVHKRVDKLSHLTGKCLRVRFKMSSGSAKLSGMFCPIASTSAENKEVEFSMEIAAISEANSGFPNYNED